MYIVNGFWHAAARLSGRVDFTMAARADVDLSESSVRALTRLGIPAVHARSLRHTETMDSPDPFVRLTDPAYPTLLRGLPFAPPVLFLRGNISLLDEPCVAIVGARRCTSTGTRMARKLALAVSRAGAVIVSGMAHGIDAAAHRADPTRTIAVLGQGLSAPMSSYRARLAGEILDAGGLLVSEFLPGYPPNKWTFPLRNRIVAGLAAATVVVEAARRSGALITARHALEAGREVLAVPGSPLSPTSTGCLDLIEQGAGIARDGRCVVDALNLPPTIQAKPDPIAALISDNASFEELLHSSKLSIGELTQCLAALELAGKIRRLPGDRYGPSEG